MKILTLAIWTLVENLDGGTRDAAADAIDDPFACFHIFKDLISALRMRDSVLPAIPKGFATEVLRGVMRACAAKPHEIFFGKTLQGQLSVSTTSESTMQSWLLSTTLTVAWTGKADSFDSQSC